MSEGFGPGHNQPPSAPLVDVAEVRTTIEINWAEQKWRSDDLVAAIGRWIEQHPDGVVDDDDQGRTSDFVKQCKSHLKLAEETRTSVKEPLREAGAAVDAYFNGEIRAPLSLKLQTVERAMTAYAKQKATEAQAAAEQAGHGDAQLPSRAELARTHGDFGSVAALTGRWVAEITDPHLVPRQYCSPDLKRIKYEMEASRIMKKGPPTIRIPGVTFRFEEKVSVR